MNIKDIAATLAILGSGTIVVGCAKDKPATEVPANGDPAPVDDGPQASDPDAAEGQCSAEVSDPDPGAGDPE